MSDISPQAADDDRFIADVLDPIPGWLAPVTAAATMTLLHYQDSLSTRGGFVEIGVYGGKFLSLLARHARQLRSQVLGLDTYHHFTPEQVSETVARASAGVDGPLLLTLQKGSSQDVTTNEMERLLGGQARMIHIDGSHECDDVLWDIEISEPLLTPSGLLVLDDIFSPRDIGVTEAFFRFQLLRPRALVPIAYVGNKLFLTRHSHGAAYRGALERFVMQDTIHPQTAQAREFLRTGGRRMIETKLSGHPYLVVT